jgi:hypothetical protein
MVISKHEDKGLIVFPDLGLDRRAFCPDEPLNLRFSLWQPAALAGSGAPSECLKDPTSSAVKQHYRRLTDVGNISE